MQMDREGGWHFHKTFSPLCSPLPFPSPANPWTLKTGDLREGGGEEMKFRIVHSGFYANTFSYFRVDILL